MAGLKNQPIKKKGLSDNQKALFIVLEDAYASAFTTLT